MRRDVLIEHSHHKKKLTHIARTDSKAKMKILVKRADQLRDSLNKMKQRRRISYVEHKMNIENQRMVKSLK